MNHKKITTSKGEFVLVDAETLDKVSGQALVDEYGDYIILSEATEEDASKVVDISFNTPRIYKDYINNMPGFTAVDSLHSLLKSKGIDLNNGNWYLFKKI